jgi:Protein of unknown function (DUF2800)
MIRHSALPKLAQCPCYESNPVAGPAAERGTKMDAAFRALLMGKPVTGDLTTEELEAVMWAVDTARDIADGADIEADEVNLKVNTPGMEHEGTEDARCESEAISFDLKSGSLRSYYEQAAAYALGNMERTFEENWTFVLLFCDQREFTRLEFNHAQASAVVADVVASATDPNRKPTACEYCSWCRKADTCVALTAPVVETLATVESTVSLEEIRQSLLADPVRLGKFLKAESIFSKEFVKPLKDAAKAQMVAGAEVPGWKLQHQKGSETFNRLSIVRAAVAGKSGLDDLVEALGGEMGGATFRAWCGKMGVAVQDGEAEIGKEIVKLVEDKPKKARAAK